MFKIPEAEVVYRLVEKILNKWEDIDDKVPIIVNLDGAHFKIKRNGEDFTIYDGFNSFYSDHNWNRMSGDSSSWQGVFTKRVREKNFTIKVISDSRDHDVIVTRIDSKKSIFECKKGIYPKMKGGQELNLIRDAICQIILHDNYSDKTGIML